MIAESHLNRSVTFGVAGHQYRLSCRQVLEQARQALVVTTHPFAPPMVETIG